MISEYSVSWARTAETDLINIVEYIVLDSPRNALKIFNQIKQKAADLTSFPEKGRIVPELQAQGINQYRELIISPWRLIYRISDKNVYVLSAIDSRQNVEDILLSRFIL